MYVCSTRPRINQGFDLLPDLQTSCRALWSDVLALPTSTFTLLQTAFCLCPIATPVRQILHFLWLLSRTPNAREAGLVLPGRECLVLTAHQSWRTVLPAIHHRGREDFEAAPHVFDTGTLLCGGVCVSQQDRSITFFLSKRYGLGSKVCPLGLPVSASGICAENGQPQSTADGERHGVAAHVESRRRSHRWPCPISQTVHKGM